MQAPNPYAPPKADVADMQAREAAPPLWNPNAAASWSLFFSPIFGAILHMKNWQAMGEPEKAAASRTWAIASAAFLVLMILLSVWLADNKALDAVARFGGFGILVAWYYALGKSQNAFVLARYGQDYPRKGWLKPLGIALGAWLGFMVAAVIVGFIAAMLAGNT